LTSFKIGRYEYCPFNIKEKSHLEFYQKLLKELDNEDSDLINNLGDIDYMFEKSNMNITSFEINYPTTYLVSDNGKFVAFVYVYTFNRVVLLYLGVLEEYRMNHYSTNINRDLSDYILKNFDIDYIQVCIDEENIGSIKAVTNAGFVQDANNPSYFTKRC